MQTPPLHATSVAIPGVATVLASAFLFGAPQTTTSSVSILAYDPMTGEFGVASASEAPLIGMNLEFFDLDAGGVVIHGGPHLDIGQRVLIALGEGLPPGRAIGVGLAAAGQRESRQVLAISKDGAAAFTGDRLDRHSSQQVGGDFVVAGQRLPNPDVVNAMAAQFQESDGPLADRLMGSLRAGRNAAGEEGQFHSAALLVIGPAARFATRDRTADLRIDFVPGDAVAALTRLRAEVDSVYGVDNR